MNIMKTKFEKWLQAQGLSEKTKSGKLGTIVTYTDAINGICKERFSKEFTQKDTDKTWKLLCEEIIPIAAKYQELSHKEYMLDRVMVWYAIDYFSSILSFMYGKENGYETKPDINLYLFHNQQNYFIKSICLHELNEYTQYFATLYFNRDFRPKKVNSYQLNELKKIVDKIIWDNKIKEVHNVGFHIVYKQSRVKNRRSALNHFYNCFINPSFKNPLEQHPVLMAIKNRPDRLQFFSVIQEITGEQPRQIKIKDNISPMSLTCPLQQYDLAEIFDIDRKSIQKYLEAKVCYASSGDFDTTELRTYYSVAKTNEYLSQYYHKVAVDSDSSVSFKEKGYEHWKRKSYIIKNVLHIGKDAFDTLIGKKYVLDTDGKPKRVNCPYIDYFSEANTRYYLPVFLDYAAKHP